MTDDENCQPRSGVIGTKMTIGLAAYATAFDHFQVVVQQPTLATARTSPEHAPAEGCRR